MMRGLLAKAERVIVDGTLMKRLGAPGDIAGAVLLLASPAGSWLTGCTLPVDGGSLLSKF